MPGSRRCRASGLALVCALMLAGSVHSAPALTQASGASAPDLVLSDLEGRSHNLAAYRGKVVLINFWATWCEPCRREMASIQRLRNKFREQPFLVLTINVDESEPLVRQFMTTTRLDLPVLMDPGKMVTRRWGVRGLPATHIVGLDGRLRYRLVGDLDWSSDAVVGVITQLIRGG